MSYEYIKEYKIKKDDNWWDIFKYISGEKEIPDIREKFIFRGVENDEYDLKPSSLRKEIRVLGEKFKDIHEVAYGAPHHKNKDVDQTLAENHILLKFFDFSDKMGLKLPSNERLRRIVHNDIDFEDFNKNFPWWPNDDYLEIMGLAQHYGLPTRLLDWTYDYKIALYFATIGYLKNKNKNKDCALWALNYKAFEYNFPTLPLQNSQNEADKYNLNRPDLFDAYSFIGFYRPEYNKNPNLNAQKGLFTFLRENENTRGLNKTSLNKLMENMNYNEDINEINNSNSNYKNFMVRIKENNEKLMYKFTIHHKFKSKILKELSSDGYSAQNLFPGYEGIVKAIKNNALLHKNKEKCTWGVLR